MTPIPDPSSNKLCQRCRAEMATHYVRIATGRQVRCQKCATRSRPSGFNKAKAK